MDRSHVKESLMPPTLMGNRIAGARSKLGLGLREAARRCNIDPTKLADAEAGKDSRASTVAAIARGLSVSADWLLGVIPGDEVVAIASTDVLAAGREIATPPTPLLPEDRTDDADPHRLIVSVTQEVAAIWRVLALVSKYLAQPELDQLLRDIHQQLDQK